MTPEEQANFEKAKTLIDESSALFIAGDFVQMRLKAYEAVEYGGSAEAKEALLLRAIELDGHSMMMQLRAKQAES